ncbi:MAG: hypothetical protein M3362_25325, partial [Acidobacteriota bacterium]|nr:hypothetical protein [Acidobacteriota bacterium]
MEKQAMNKQPARIFILDDDSRRHNWFTRHLSDSHVDIASDVSQARKLLSTNSYDAIFLDHDLLPEHYRSEEYDDESTVYAIASWLSANPTLQQTSNITIHTRNADAALRMVEELRDSGRLAAYVPFPLLTNRIKQLVSHLNSLDVPLST